MMNFTYTEIIAVILAYLLGSLATSVWIGKIFFSIDIRQVGSRNAGATNTFRILGYKMGFLVLFLDILKAFVAVKLSMFFSHQGMNGMQLLVFKIILGIAAVIGHVFPIYIGFRGGKGIATLVGAGLALCPYSVLVTLLVFTIFFLLFQYVSLSSIMASISFPLIHILIFNEQMLPMMLFTIAVALFVPVTHRKNILRLIKGEESKIQFSKKSSEA